MTGKLDHTGFFDLFPPAAEIPNGSPIAALWHLPEELTKDFDVDGTAGEVVTNLFSFNGAFQLTEIHGHITDASEIVTASGFYIDIYDGANSVPLTADGLDLSGAIVNSMFVKDALVANPLELLDADQNRYVESPFQKPFVGGAINIKNGGTHFVRARIDTDANTDITLSVTMRYIHLDEDTIVTVV